jgi:hypothetical protein
MKNDMEDNEIMLQVTSPPWFQYEGVKAPQGTFVHILRDPVDSDIEVYRMVLAEEADEEGIAWDKECQERHELQVQLLSEREQERMWAEDDLDTAAASMSEEGVEELREECAAFLQWIVENKLEEFWLDEVQHVMRGKIEGGSAAELLVLYRTVLRLGRKWQETKGGGEEGVEKCLLTLSRAVFGLRAVVCYILQLGFPMSEYVVSNRNMSNYFEYSTFAKCHAWQGRWW